ncbi:hypothetical protein AAY473_030574, partial [Plecturocebus cupreus]
MEAEKSQIEKPNPAGMQWHNLSSLQPPPAELKLDPIIHQRVCLSLKSSGFQKQIGYEFKSPRKLTQHISALEILILECSSMNTAYCSFNLLGTASHGLALSSRLECRGRITAHCSLNFPSSRDPPILASRAAGTPGVHQHVGWFLYFFAVVEIEFCHVDQAILKLLSSGDLPTLASQSAGIT